MSITISPEIAASIIGITLTVICTLIGIIYRLLQKRVDEAEEDLEDVDGRIASLEEKVDTLFSWAFGNEEDHTDRGVSQDIEDGFSEINERLDKIEEKHDNQHEELIGQVRAIIDALHDEEALDVERDDFD